MRIQKTNQDLLELYSCSKVIFDKIPPISDSRTAIVLIRISVFLTTVDDESMRVSSVMFPLVSKAT